MFVKQSELFWDLGRDFVKEVVEKSEKESVARGYILFFEGEPAIHFYTLIKGSVRIKAGEAGRGMFVLNHTGESFGWSSLVGRGQYSATAECLAPTLVARFHHQDFEKICEKYPVDGRMFMKKLAGLLGQRLLRSYDMMASSMRAEETVYGTGQVQEMAD
jgi:CRP-like cAMP-binding protein